MKQFFIIVIFILFCAPIIAQNDMIDWETDLVYIKNDLPEKHVNLFIKITEEEFNYEMNKLIRKSHSLNNYQVLIGLSQILAKIGDSHTYLNYGRFVTINDLLPINLYWFNDGLYILYSRASFSAILGQRLVAINDFPIEQIIDSIATVINVDNDAYKRSTLPKMIGFIPYLEYFGFTNNDRIELITINNMGLKISTIIHRSELEQEKVVQFQPEKMAFCWENRNRYFVYSYFEVNRILYIQYNFCWSKELEILYGSKEKAENLPSFSAFQNEIFELIKQQPVEKLVFDLRFNSGGTPQQGTEFIKKIAEIEQINQKGKLFVVTGIHTFSSGIINLIDFKKYTNAIFVGSTTGGKPNHFGEIRQLTLPSSGITINYSTEFFNGFEPDTNSFYPDVEINSSFYYYRKGIDPVFEYIRNYK